MIGHIKHISKFGLFVTVLSSDLSQEALLALSYSETGLASVQTGLLRWSETPSGEKYHKGEAINVTVKAVREDKKIELALVDEAFLAKYEQKMITTLDRLTNLHTKNQEVRNL